MKSLPKGKSERQSVLVSFLSKHDSAFCLFPEIQGTHLSKGDYILGFQSMFISLFMLIGLDLLLERKGNPVERHIPKSVNISHHFLS